MRPSPWTLAALAVCALAVTAAARQAVVKPDAQGVVRLSPDDLTWGAGSNMQSLVIAGDPNKPGIYVVRNKFPPGTMSRPHFHNQDRFVTVIKGTWWTAVGADGDVYDPSKTVAIKTGGFMKHPAGVHHYDGAKDEETIVQIIGMGPVTTTQLTPGDPPVLTAMPRQPSMSIR
jgi:oxalate decarboxylase/phosphoglucose isomerase-like protein (cupin superfamily)